MNLTNSVLCQNILRFESTIEFLLKDIIAQVIE